MNTQSNVVSSNIYIKKSKRFFGVANFLRKYYIPLLSFCAIIFIFISPTNSLTFAQTALNMCAYTIVPTLFPFFVLSGLIINSNFPQLIDKPSAIPFVLSLFAGAPVGSVITCDLYSQGYMSKSESELVLCYTNNISPVFIIGTLGTGFLGTPIVGYFLFIIHMISSLLIGLFCKHISKLVSHSATTYSQNAKQNSFFITFSNVVSSSITTVFFVCGCVVFFSVASGLLTDLLSFAFPNLPNILKILITGIAEISNGLALACKYANTSPTSLPCLLPLLSFMLGLGGFSKFMQVAVICSQHNLSLKKYLFAKIFHGFIAAALTFVVLCIFTNF